MPSNLTVDDRAFLSGLEKLVTRHARTAETIVGEIGREVANEMRRNAPRRTGRLRRGITSHTGRDRRGPYAQVDVAPFYASWIEFGRLRNAARPFVRPALEQASRLLRANARRFR